MSYGFGRIVGLGAAVAIAAAYILFAAGVNGVTSYFAQTSILDLSGGFDMDWRIYAYCFIALMFLVTYFHVEIVARILGILLIGELLILMIFSFAVVVKGGGPDGIVWEALNPAGIFSGGEGVEGAARVFGVGLAGVGFFACFWSWVGFEMAPNYAEEARNPKKMMAYAIYISCIGLGVLYTFWSWMLISAYGSSQDQWVWAVATQYGAAGDNPPVSPGNGLPEGDYASVFYPVAQEFAGIGIANIFKVLIITGSFACALAFWQTSNRYVFAMGREGMLPRILGRTHSKHKSPFVATILVGLMVVMITVALHERRRRRWPASGARVHRGQPADRDPAARDVDPLPGQRDPLPADGGRRDRDHGLLHREARDGFHWWKTFVAPHPRRRGDLVCLLPDDEEPGRDHVRRLRGLGEIRPAHLARHLPRRVSAGHHLSNRGAEALRGRRQVRARRGIASQDKRR